MPRLACGHSVHDLGQPHYCSYLRLAELLALQPPPDSLRHHDELLFITVHQTTELWFKQLLHELGQIVALLDEERPGSALRLVQRATAVLQLLTTQLGIFATMAPQDFFAFRGALSPASGAQSQQFHLLVAQAGGDVLVRAEPERSRPSVRASFLALLERRDVALDALYTPLGQDGPHHDLFLLAEGLISYDQQFQQWRAAHLAVAERLLSKGLGGTGGSSGARYLAERLAGACLFPELWAVRAELWERLISP